VAFIREKMSSEELFNYIVHEAFNEGYDFTQNIIDPRTKKLQIRHIHKEPNHLLSYPMYKVWVYTSDCSADEKELFETPEYYNKYKHLYHLHFNSKPLGKGKASGISNSFENSLGAKQRRTDKINEFP
jgi:hypothetical protein